MDKPETPSHRRANVPPPHETDLLAHWRSTSAPAKPAGPAALAAALLKGPKLNRRGLERLLTVDGQTGLSALIHTAAALEVDHGMEVIAARAVVK